MLVRAHVKYRQTAYTPGASSAGSEAARSRPPRLWHASAMLPRRFSLGASSRLNVPPRLHNSLSRHDTRDLRSGGLRRESST
jgi:hypothetical protein